MRRNGLRPSAAIAAARALALSLAVALSLALSPDAAAAQRAPTRSSLPVPEGRLDVIVASESAVHAGGGLFWAAGTYLRAGIVAGIGGSEAGLSGRVDIVTRFHLDPFRQHRWGPYAGGGLSGRFDEDRASRLYLLLLAGVEGPTVRGAAVSLEVGLGGGGRAGLVLRPVGERR